MRTRLTPRGMAIDHVGRKTAADYNMPAAAADPQRAQAAHYSLNSVVSLRRTPIAFRRT